MNREPVGRRAQVRDRHQEGPQRSAGQVVSRAPKLVMGLSGVAWLKPGSCQPPDPSFDTKRHQKITHALLDELGRRELIPTPVPEDIRSARALLEHENLESLKRIERNRLIYPERLSPVEETLFMTPRKKAVMPTYIRTRVAGMYRSISDGNMNAIESEPEEGFEEEIGIGKVRLFPLGGDRPGKQRHRLDLWRPKPRWEE